MGKFDGILIMSDLDGTLCHNESVSAENSQAIRYFQSEGGLFSIASGRKPDCLRRWKDDFIPNTWSAMLNGAILCDANGENFVFEQPADPNIVTHTQELLQAHPRLEGAVFCGAYTDYTLRRGIPIDPALLPDPIFKCLLRTPSDCSDEHVAAVRAYLPSDYIVMRSWINGIEYQRIGTGKGDAVKRMRSLLGDAARLTVAVGNYENDVDMIRAADIGYAVGNAIPSVKAAADRITAPDVDHAIARIIEELERETIPSI